MNTTQTGNAQDGATSKIVRAYDEAIARAEIDPDNPPTDLAEMREQLDSREPNRYEHRAGRAEVAFDLDVIESIPEPGDDLRDREFPVSPEMAGSGSRKLLVDQDTIGDDESRCGGPIGTKAGDIQPGSDVPSILDQNALAPDLGQEQR